MPQAPRLTYLVVEKLERLEEQFHRASADGVICCEQRAYLSDGFMAAISVATYADESLDYGLRAARRGIDNTKLREKLANRVPMPASLYDRDPLESA